MIILAEIKEEDVIENYVEGIKIKYNLRKAARTVMFDKKNQIALLNIKNLNFYKLPGGGIEENEEIETALHRESLEEVGAKIKILEEIGTTIEYRDTQELLQISYCYTSKVLELSETNRTEDEIEDGMELEWHEINDALSLVENSRPSDYMGKFIIKRDAIFIKEAIDLII